MSLAPPLDPPLITYQVMQDKELGNIKADPKMVNFVGGGVVGGFRILGSPGSTPEETGLTVM